MKKVVNAIIIDKNKFLIVERKKEKIHSNKWLFPGGLIKEGESKKEALKREVKEEVGLDIKKIIKKIFDYKYKRHNGEVTYGESYFVKTKTNKVIPGHEISKFKWITIEEFEKFKHVEGMDEEAMKALFESTK